MTLSSTPPAAPRSLPVGRTVATIYRTLLDLAPQFPRIVVLPIALSTMLGVFDALLGLDPILSTLIFLIPGNIVYTLFAVAWHRLTLIGAEAAHVASWDRCHTTFFVYALVLSLLDFVFLLPGIVGPDGTDSAEIAMLVLLWTFALMPLTLFLLVRLSFVFPAAAVGESFGFADSWRTTRGRFWRISAISILVGLPFIIAIMAFMAADPTVFDGAAGEEIRAAPPLSLGVIFEQAIGALAGYAFIATAVTGLSITFRTCTGWIAAAPPTTPPATT
ncbi:MAG: hypothetical protein GY791_18445 [Alphaproteobacteria bacterium]|nr:hypothetical protein [Alphaproteobacteria bacterium]